VSTIEQAAKRLEELRQSGFEARLDSGRADAGAPDRHSKGSQPGHQAPPDRHAVPSLEVAPSAKRSSASASGAVENQSERAREVSIDLARLAAVGMITPDAQRSRIADEFRVIKRPLLDNIAGKAATPVARANLIMVTSALPGEGKTFTAINLAMSIAMEMDRTVLLVDADVPHAALLSTLGIPTAPGLMDVLTDPRRTVGDVLLRTNVPKLSVLPAGSADARATELLASQGMAELVDELANRYPDRVIVFDAPPLLATTESRVLATHMGQIVFVVQANSTTYGAVGQAMATLQKCPVVMTMLNMSSHSEAGAYYGQYGYRYGGGASEAAAAQPAKGL
jgi:receptor protein-tyrosine kinase